MKSLGVGLTLLLLAAAPGWSEECTEGEDPNPGVLFATDFGDIAIELCRLDAPATVDNFLSYIEDGSYTDTTFIHRMTGDPTDPLSFGVLQGGGYSIDDSEPPLIVQVARKDPIAFESTGLLNERGTIAMARLGSDFDSATSEWFINAKDNPTLDGGYAVFGVVTEGMDAVDAIWDLETCVLNSVFRELPRADAHPCSAGDLVDYLVYVPEPGLPAGLVAGLAALGTMAGRRHGAGGTRPVCRSGKERR